MTWYNACLHRDLDICIFLVKSHAFTSSITKHINTNWATIVLRTILRPSALPITMMRSPNGNIFRVTGPRGFHRSPVNSPHKGQWRGALLFSLICTWVKGWAYNREGGDLVRHSAHYDVTVMVVTYLLTVYTVDLDLVLKVSLGVNEDYLSVPWHQHTLPWKPVFCHACFNLSGYCSHTSH